MGKINIQELEPIRSNFLIFGAPEFSTEEKAEVQRCLESGWIGTGPRVTQFEQNFANFKNTDPGLVSAVNSCTAALHLSLIALDIGAGDEVLTTPMTFCATVNAIIHTGAKPVLVDIDPVTMNISLENVARSITPKTKAILPVHFAGRPCDMAAIMDLAERYNLKVIEDCAHAIEAEWSGQKVGTIGDFGCFSFYVTKNLVTGEGGMVVAKDPSLSKRVKRLSLHGMSLDAWDRFGSGGYKHYQVVECGFKYNMMDLQAALGIHQLLKIENNWQRRQEIWNRYQEAFKGLPVETPAPVEPNTRHAYHLYTLLIDEVKTGISRDDFLNGMTKLGIGVGVHYLGIFEHPYYQERFGWEPQDYPNARRVGQQTLSLPLSPFLSDSDVDDVIAAVRRLFSF